MTAYHHKPAPPLSHFVDTLWLYIEDQPDYRRERALPTGTVELVIHLAADPIRMWRSETDPHPRVFPGPIICGPHSEYFVLDTSYMDAILGASFKPGGAYPFLGMPSTEVFNQHVALADLWGAAAADLHERVALCATPAATLRAFEAILMERCLRADPRHPAVGFALRELECGRAVSDVVDQVGLSSRRLIDVFSRQVGLTPKLYQRVRRFQGILKQIYAPYPIDLPDLALACGYFDQAHFIHDFRAFSGLTPTEYLSMRGRHANHVPVP